MMNAQRIIVDTARTILLKQANHAGTSGLMGVSEGCKIDLRTVLLTPPLNHVMRGALSGL